jgi:hypothetical protein
LCRGFIIIQHFYYILVNPRANQLVESLKRRRACDIQCSRVNILAVCQFAAVRAHDIDAAGGDTAANCRAGASKSPNFGLILLTRRAYEVGENNVCDGQW